jgi:acyl-CoA dehydrogenase
VIDFRPSEQSSAATGRVASFVKRHIEPAEAVYAAQRRELARSGDPHGVPPVLELLKDAARAEDLWNRPIGNRRTVTGDKERVVRALL